MGFFDDITFAQWRTVWRCRDCDEWSGDRWRCFDCRDDFCEECFQRAHAGEGRKKRAKHAYEVSRKPPQVSRKKLILATLAYLNEIDGLGPFGLNWFHFYFKKIIRQQLVKAQQDTLFTNALESHSIKNSETRFVESFINRRAQGRFVEFSHRKSLYASDISPQIHLMSQGTETVFRWKGQPLLKSAFDFAVYHMLLWDLKPRTIIELGSGNGTSAVWLADIMKSYEIDSHVYSLDLRKPKFVAEGVTFIQGNTDFIAKAFPRKLVHSMPHPWLVIEDCHHNIYGILEYFDSFLKKGDYVFIEDSWSGKEDAIGRFCQRYPSRYLVDSYYTDFFGQNSTTAQDSILVKMK